jgi:hypothetical protein
MLTGLWLAEKFFFWANRPGMGVSIFLKHLRYGIHYGYPMCCVLQFSFQEGIGLSKQGLRRGGVRIGENKTFIPCSYHMKRDPRWRTHAEWFTEAKYEKSIRGKFMTGQSSLNNFYQSVKFRNPRLAVEMSDDIIAVALYALAEDKSPGQDSANSLRERSHELPEVLRRVLETALTELGYS